MRPTLLALEERTLLSTFTVNNPTDTPVAGETDLRQAIGDANAATSASRSTSTSPRRRRSRCQVANSS